jgi:hypothetical protein
MLNILVSSFNYASDFTQVRLIEKEITVAFT